MKRKKIAIIGGGGAGATAAWALHTIHDITLFEAEKNLGGHAYAHPVKIDNKIVNVDMGVEFFTEKLAPNLMSLFNYLQIETFVAPLTFGASFPEQNFFWSNNQSFFVNIDRSSLSKECSRFHIQMHDIMHQFSSKTKHISLGQFLEENNYSSTFIYNILMPLLTTFSSTQSPILEYSLTFSFISFTMGLLSFFHPTYWRKTQNGIGSYLSKLENVLKNNIILNAAVHKVVRHREKIEVFYNGNQQCFDYIILATHADRALEIIDQPTQQEEEILSSFKYTTIKSVLHSDGKILSQELKPYHCYCEFRGSKSHGPANFHGTLTRVLNNLEEYKNINVPLLVSFDPKIEINEEKILCIKDWKIPQLRPQDMLNKKRISNIQGKNNTWFCGTDTSVTGHEGAITSGLVVAHALGSPYPFKDNFWAKIQFEIVQNIMGLYSPQEKLGNTFQNSLFKVAKVFNLNKSQMSRALMDLYA